MNAYTEWQDARFREGPYDINISNANLNDLSKITMTNLEYSMCRFIPEVTKSKGEGLILVKHCIKWLLQFRNFCS